MKGTTMTILGSADAIEFDAHGSTFDNTGTVLEGPASDPLRSFPVHERDGVIRISLKA